MKRCTKCILPENYPGISFDDKGVCSRCFQWLDDYHKVDYSKQRGRLDELIEHAKMEAKSNGLPFDVIVPVSGGKDSAYVLYVMKEVYHCRILAVNYNNTFQTEQAYRNIMNLVDVFDVDLRLVSIRPQLLKSAYNESLIRTGEFCQTCNCSGYWILLSFINDLFLKYNYTPLIVGGWSRLFEYDPQINTLDFVQYRKLLEESSLLEEFSKVLDVRVLNVLSQEQDVRQNVNSGFIQLPDYWKWDHNEIIDTLMKYGWQKMKGEDTHFDCWASPLADLLERNKYGLNQKTIIESTYVRAGLASRTKVLMEEELSYYKPIDNRLVEQFTRHIQYDGNIFESLNLLKK